MASILVVDDEVDLHDLIRLKFKSSINKGEFNFFFATNGEEALKILENNPDLSIIITDIKMPIMDGLTLLANLTKLKRNIKAIVVSAYGDLSNIRIAMNRGASDFIMKPIDFVDFELTLRKIIEAYTTLNTALKAESHMKEIELELELAKSIQESMLPNDFQPLPGLEIAGKMIPAKQVGGDFFDFFVVDDHRLAIVIADVSGSGISAALFMAVTKSLIRALMQQNLKTHEVMSSLSKTIGGEKTQMYTSAFCGILDINTGSLVFCNAGHPIPFIISKDGSCKKIEYKEGLPLGHNQDPYSFQESTSVLQKDDCLFLYTNGVLKTMNASGETFSELKLAELLKPLSSKSPAEILQSITSAIQSFGTNPQVDDLALLMIRYKGSNL